MQHDAELAAWIKLSLVPGLGGQSLRRLLTAFGLPQQVLAAGRGALARIVSAEIAGRILSDLDSPAVDAALEWAAADSHAVLTLADGDYPQPLLETPDPPALLYLHGRRELLARPGLAVVGSRNATPQGISNAEQFARAFSAAGLTIVSGLALGIDAAAHRGGLEGTGSTIAVLGTGADILYATTFGMFAQNPMMPKLASVEAYVKRCLERPAYARAGAKDAPASSGEAAGQK